MMNSQAGAAMLSWFVGGPHHGVQATLQLTRLVLRGYHPTDVFAAAHDGTLLARAWVFGDTLDAGAELARCGFRVVHTEEENEMIQDLEARRKELKISRAQLSERSGLSQAKIARIEKGGSRTTDDEIATLTKALEVVAEEQGVAPAVDPQ
jgi:acyl-CoA reductase-like NAD-dependent aldehyde dehydrogenase